MKTDRTLWTPEMDDALVEAIEARASASMAARNLSRKFRVTVTRHAAIGRAYRKGWQFRSDREKTHNHVYNRPCKRPRRHGPRLVKAKVEAAVIPLEPLPTGPLNDFPLSGCKWIHGEIANVWRCCGAETKDGPYCSHHAHRSINHNSKPSKQFTGKLPKWAA